MFRRVVPSSIAEGSFDSTADDIETEELPQDGKVCLPDTARSTCEKAKHHDFSWSGNTSPRTVADDSLKLGAVPEDSQPKLDIRTKQHKRKSTDPFFSYIAQIVELYEIKVRELHAASSEHEERERDRGSIFSVTSNNVDFSSIFSVSSRHGKRGSPRASNLFFHSHLDSMSASNSLASNNTRTSELLPIPMQTIMSLRTLEEAAQQAHRQDQQEHFASEEDLDYVASNTNGGAARFDIFQIWLPQGQRNTSLLRQTNRPSRLQRTQSLYTDFVKRDWLRRFVVHPASNVRLSWNSLTAMLVAIDVIFAPFQMAFDPIERFDDGAIPILFGFLWSFDIALNFFTSYYDSGHLVKDVKSIACKYAVTWFIVDLSCVAMDWVLLAASSGEVKARKTASPIQNSLNVLRVLRLVRVCKMKHLLQTISDSIDSESRAIFFNLLIYTTFLVVVSHYIACMWYIVGVEAHGEDSWVQRRGINGQPISHRYSVSLFWALTLFASASDIFPTNETEQFFAVFMVASSIIMFSSLLAMVTGSVMQLWQLRYEDRRQCMLLRRYLRISKISTETTQRIERYLDFLEAKTKHLVSEDQVTYLNKLSQPLREQLRYESFRLVISKHPLTDYMNKVTKALTRAVTSLCLARGDEVFTSGEDATQAFLLADLGHGDLVYWPGAKCESQLQQQSTTSKSVWERRRTHVPHERLGGEDSRIVAEPTLWTTWVFLGDLEAYTMCQIAAIDGKILRHVAKHDIKLQSAAHHYAVAYVEQLNGIDDFVLTDLLTINVRHKLAAQSVMRAMSKAFEEELPGVFRRATMKLQGYRDSLFSSSSR